MQCLPGHRAAMLLSKWRCVKLSSGTVTSLTARKAKKFREAHIRLHDILSSGQVSVKHLDEPGFRVAGRLEWLHILCSRLLSHLRLGERRGDIPRDLEGTVIHDCLSSYFTLENVRHGTGVCNAQHLIRELNAAYDIDGEPWAVEIKAILYDERDLAKPLAVHVKTQSTLLLSRKSYDDMRLVDRKTSCITKVYRLSRFHQIKKQGKKRRAHNNALRFPKNKRYGLLIFHDLSVNLLPKLVQTRAMTGWQYRLFYIGPNRSVTHARLPNFVCGLNAKNVP